jgi:two-component system, response regulator PdtaR
MEDAQPPSPPVMLEAGSADEALLLLEQRSDVELLFTDVHMPGSMDGLELAEHVHARWPNVLLVVTSGRSHLADGEVPDDGHFIAKPYRLSEVVQEFRALISKPH